MADMTIRYARADDPTAISALHFNSWLSAYRGMLPDSYLDGPLKEELEAYWTQALPRAGELDTILVAVRDDVLCGFIAVWNDAERAGMAFIDNLHVDPALRGGGIGRRLIAEAAAQLQAKDYQGVYLLVLTGNTGARRLYERLGGVCRRELEKLIGGHPAVQAEYVWTDLSGLAGGARGVTV